MAITFLQKKKQPKYLNLVLILIAVVVLIVICQNFLRSEAPTASYLSPIIPKQIDIDWQLLQSAEMTELQAFEEVGPLEEEVGRENPFIPY